MHVLLLETIALIGATVHTMEPGPDPGGVLAAKPAIVLIEDGLIVAVGPDVAIPDDAERVELTGLHLVPGLTDAYCSFDAEHDALWLASGVTTARDGGMRVGDSVPEKTPSMRDRHPGPQLRISSPIFGSNASKRPDGFRLGAPEQAAEQIVEVLNLVKGASSSFDFFQHDGSLSEAQLRVVCQAGIEEGVPTWGPLPTSTGIARARAAGQVGLLGLDSLLPKGARFDELTEAQEGALNAAINDLAAGGWVVCPLLMGTGRIVRGSGPEDPPALAALGRDYQLIWRSDLEMFRMIRQSPSWPAVEASLSAQRALVRRLHEAGVVLVPGSGAPSAGIAPGGGLIDELEEWVAAGIPVAEVLVLATRGAAEAAGGAVPAGQIAPGMQANLLALASDPRRSISAFRAPEMMILRGQAREGFQLEDAAADLALAQTAAKLARSQPIDLAAPPVPAGELMASGILEVSAYGERTAVERYAVTQLPQGRMAYSARVRIPASPSTPASEMVMVQVIHDGLVDFFEVTVDVLDEEGQPQLKEGKNAFLARGRKVEGAQRLGIERARYGVRVDSKRSDEPIAAVDGSMALMGLIASQHFPAGPSFILGLEGPGMEPLVDRVALKVEPDLHRLDLVSQRSQRAFGMGPNGEILFAARATGGGRVDGAPAAVRPEDARSALPLPADRVYTGDPKTWAEDAAATPMAPGGNR